MQRSKNAPLTALVMALILALALSAPALAQDGEKKEQQKPQGPPPTLVVTAQSDAGSVVPRADYVGTVQFPEVSSVATEVGGRVLEVRFDEGQRVRAGQALVALDTALLKKNLDAARAGLAQVQASLELARIELARRQELIASGSISQQEFDQARFTVMELESSADSRRAEAERLALELEKTAVPAPFSGVVLERAVERGQWLSAGAAVARIARDDALEVMVDVPQDLVGFLAKGQAVEVTVAGRRLPGDILAVIPEGDVATRTFPVKIGVRGGEGLASGMEARAHLPSGNEVQAVRVPRDAVALLRGENVVFVPENGTAKMIPVTVVAYVGLDAWLQGPGLAGDMPVVVKGKERLYPGAPVRFK